MLKLRHRPGLLDGKILFTSPHAVSVFQVYCSAMKFVHVVATQRTRLLCVSGEIRSICSIFESISYSGRGSGSGWKHGTSRKPLCKCTENKLGVNFEWFLDGPEFRLLRRCPAHDNRNTSVCLARRLRCRQASRQRRVAPVSKSGRLSANRVRNQQLPVAKGAASSQKPTAGGGENQEAPTSKPQA